MALDPVYQVSGHLFYPCQQENADNEKQPQKNGGIPHTTGKLCYETVKEGTYYNPHFFCHIIKAEEGSGISGLRQEFGVRRP